MKNQEFFQTGPQLGNQYHDDPLLRLLLEWRLPAAVFKEVDLDLQRFGARVVGEMLPLADECETQVPRHIPFDPWGRRIDDIWVTPAWNKMADIAAEEGIVAIGYERKQKEFSRLVQFSKLYLYSPSSAFFSCPLAMTDGAARAIELYGDDELKQNAFKHLTSRTAREFWTSGQWMTERSGGSDVSETETIARPVGDGRYTLHGTKWFTSATTSQMAMTLARIEGAPEGSKGLSLFYLELRDLTGRLDNIEVHRLKDKLGTKALPTAELSLRGTTARLIAGEGGGVKKIASLFNITRMYNAVCALGATRRALALALDYSKKRVAFGKRLTDHPLHAETMGEQCVEFYGNVHLTMHLAILLGKDETGVATSDESAILRLLTPIAKLYTAKSGLAITSECVECFGGAGYVEDTGIPKLLRDAQVFSIWEGTTNVLSLDVLRAIQKENALEPFLKDITIRLGKLSGKNAALAAEVNNAVQRIQSYARNAENAGSDYLQAAARGFAYSLARTYTASLMLEFAEADSHDVLRFEAAKRWIAAGLTLLNDPSSEHRKLTQEFIESTR